MAIRILFLSANPSDTQKLQLVEECNDIDDKLRVAEYRDQFDIVQRHAIRIDNLIYILLRFKPEIVHFSGHGSEEGALVFQNSDGNAQEVPPRALTDLFRIVNKDKDIRCIFLNACYSEPQAEAISDYVDCVIGMSQGVTDTAARQFAAAVYQALGFGKSIKDAFDLGIVQLGFSRSDEHIPKLRCRPGVDPSKIFILNGKSR